MPAGNCPAALVYSVADHILRYVRHIERAKVASQREARRVAKELDFDELDDDHAALLVTLLLDLLDDNLDGLAVDLYDELLSMGLEPEDIDLDGAVESVKANVEADAAAAVEAYMHELDSRVDELVDSVGEESAERILENDKTAFVIAAVAGLVAVMISVAEKAVNLVAVEVRDELLSKNKNQDVRWVTVQDKNRCDGAFSEACLPRHNKVKSYQQWKELGLPKSPNLLCCAYHPDTRPCRCVVVSAGYEVGNEPVSVSEMLNGEG